MEHVLILLVILVIAFLYASVGHGGASGYLGMMVILGISPTIMRPSALILNIVVSSLATYQFYNAGYLHFKKLLPFLLLSVPMAFIGARIPLSDPVYKIILGICLLASVARMLLMHNVKMNTTREHLPLLPSIAIGGFIGLISGMIGIGGGVLLSPMLLLLRWTNWKETAAITAPFILINSLAGIAGLWDTTFTFTPQITIWAASATLGGFLGSYWGCHKFNSSTLKFVMSIVMVIAAFKLFIS